MVAREVERQRADGRAGCRNMDPATDDGAVPEAEPKAEFCDHIFGCGVSNESDVPRRAIPEADHE